MMVLGNNKNVDIFLVIRFMEIMPWQHSVQG